MPDVKIELKKGETPDGAEEALFKAFEAQRDGSLHTNDFHDPAMVDLVNRLKDLHETEYQQLLREIFEELDKEYRDHGQF